jgi:hypothetical protein
MLAAFRTGIVRKPQGDSLFRSQVEVALGKASCIIPSPLGLGIICTPSKWIAFAPMDQGEGSVRRASRLWIWPNRCTYVNESNRNNHLGPRIGGGGGLFSTMDLPRTKLGRSALAIHHAANLQVSTSSHSKRRTACFMQKLPCMVIVHNPHNNLVYNTMVTYHIFIMIHNPMFPATSSNHISHLRLIESHIWSYNFMYQPVFCAILPEFRNIISYNYSLTCIHDKTLLSIIKVSSLQYH